MGERGPRAQKSPVHTPAVGRILTDANGLCSKHTPLQVELSFAVWQVRGWQPSLPSFYSCVQKAFYQILLGTPPQCSTGFQDRQTTYLFPKGSKRHLRITTRCMQEAFPKCKPFTDRHRTLIDLWVTKHTHPRDACANTTNAVIAESDIALQLSSSTPSSEGCKLFTIHMIFVNPSYDRECMEHILLLDTDKCAPAQRACMNTQTLRHTNLKESTLTQTPKKVVFEVATSMAHLQASNKRVADTWAARGGCNGRSNHGFCSSYPRPSLVSFPIASDASCRNRTMHRHHVDSFLIRVVTNVVSIHSSYHA